jgi:hypothetical protein
VRRLVAAAGVRPAEVPTAWDRDPEARKAGLASPEEPRRGDFLRDVLALVVIPLAVNLASSAACALVSRAVGKIRPLRPDAGELEVVAAAGAGGALVELVIAGAQR